MKETIGPLPTRTKILYGFGSIAYGIKDNGFATFLLFYYNQVIGLRADLVSLAIALALIIDAFADPVIGQLTDRTRTKIGRRHPWLYASAIPICITWLLLWHPPQASETVQFFYLLGMAILVRLALSLNEVPALALLPELTRDYHDRTSITRYRYLFGWGAGLSLMFFAYAFLLVPTADHPNGLLNPQGYTSYATIGAFAMAFAVLVAARGTHRRIVDAYHAAGKLPESAESLSDIIRTFSFRPFLLLMLAGLFAYTNQGVVFALSPYLLTHVWHFDQSDLAIYSACLFLAAITAFLIVNNISRHLGKARAAFYMVIASIILGTAPYWLYLADLFPTAGSPILLPLFLLFIILSTACGICVMILTMSMMADVTDAYEDQHHKQSEGLFASGMWLMQKSVGALGILFAGLIVAIVQLPDKAVPGTVDPAIVDNLVWIFASLTVTLGAFGAWAFTTFPLSEQDHNDRIAKLARALAAEE